jgi:CheY-like chemotaxis protein
MGRKIEIEIPPMNTESQGLSPLRILLAEDERSVAFSIAFALKLDGHHSPGRGRWGAGARQHWRGTDGFDLLITDHSMPGMTGVELVQQVREKSFRGKIMVLSAHLSGEIRAAYEALAVDAMVSKPSTCTNYAPPSRGLPPPA